MTNLPRFMIAAAHKSSGKTVVSAGLAAALRAHGSPVAVFKKGPDYIDPMWLRMGAGQAAYNLDFNTMATADLLRLFAEKARGADVSLIEANKGLFDGVSSDGSDSNAALAKLLQAPVVLVIDTRGMTRGIAPLLQGYVAFDPEVQISGVILNRTGGARHEGKLRAAVEAHTDLSVLGAIGNDPALDLSERHLGLVTPAEMPETRSFIDRVAARIASCVDLDQIRAVARSAPLSFKESGPKSLKDFGAASTARLSDQIGRGMRIGIAQDEAFGFYYPDDLEAFSLAGAELIPIDMIRDPHLPVIDGLFIGGGFPETRIGPLSTNRSMRESVRAALQGGLPCYAECGGLMYLSRSITWAGETGAMVGFFDADTVMQDRPQGRGQVRFTSTDAALWTGARGEARAHEFHYARLENLRDPLFARTVTRGFGIDGTGDALVKHNTQGGFIHLRHTAQTPWVTDFLAFVAARGG